MIPVSYFVVCLDLFLTLSCIHALLSLAQIKHFNELPLRQMGRLTVQQVSIQWWFTVAIIASLVINTLSIYIIHSMTLLDLPLRLLVAPLVALPTLSSILRRQRVMLYELQRRASLHYVVQRYSNIDYYNAEALCDEYKLSVFPIKSYERLCRNNALTSLADLHKEISLVQDYLQLESELRNDQLHLSCIPRGAQQQPIYA